jgi:hypothetical protein
VREPRFETRAGIDILAAILCVPLPIPAQAAKTEPDNQSGERTQQNTLDRKRDALRRCHEGHIR